MSSVMPLVIAPTTPRPLMAKVEFAAAEAGGAAAVERPFSPNTEAEMLRLLMPTPATPGFDLCSPRCVQVWHALFFRARRDGKWGCPDALPDDARYADLKCIRTSGLAAFWTIDLLARVCGVEPKTASRVLAELRDLGWVRYCSRNHNQQGQFYGVLFVLTIPPTELTSTARNRYKDQIAKQRQELDRKEKRVDRGASPYDRLAETEDDTPDPLLVFPGK